MRSVESRWYSITKFGYTHLQRLQYTLQQAEEFAKENGWRIECTTSFHYVLVPSEAPVVSGTDWDELRRLEFQRKQRLAQRRKQKTQNDT